jgi:DNA-binding MarR family transcriptional regulator
LRLQDDAGIYPDVKTTCYCAAVRTAARKTTALYDSILEPAGVTLAQYSLLRKIERAGTVSLTKLGKLAELDRSTVGRNVKALEELRLVRTASARDQREAAVRLTRAGEETLKRAFPLWEEAQRRVEASLGAAEAAGLRSLALNL